MTALGGAMWLGLDSLRVFVGEAKRHLECVPGLGSCSRVSPVEEHVDGLESKSRCRGGD
jgi:hypothetical protein